MRGPGDRGATLAELLVVLVIVSTLAVTALPMAETIVQRRQEIALRESLRTVRTAIDRFHADFRAGVITEEAEGVSDNGFPETLGVLVTGVEAAEEDEALRRYLRRLPENPFAQAQGRVDQQWRFIGYTQEAGDQGWNEEDIYDLRARTDRTALDGTNISNW